MNMLNRTAEDDFAEEMGWYPMLYTYGKENHMSTPQVQSENVMEFLMFINFYKRKQELEQIRLDRMNNRNK